MVEAEQSSDKNLQIVEGSQYFVEAEQSSDKNLQIVEGGQYLVDAIVMPKCMSQEEQMGLFSCNFFFRIVAIGLIFKATEQT